MLSVPLEHALQLISPTRVMLLDFHEPLSHRVCIDYSFYAFGTPFVLLRMAKGPNFGLSDTVVDVNLITAAKGATYVVGFQEKKGPTRRYAEKHFEALVKVLESPQLATFDCGIMLSGEFLAEEAYKEYWFRRLIDTVNLKYVFFRAGAILGEDWIPSLQNVVEMKWNLRSLNRETIVHTNWELRLRMYAWQETEAPITTSTTRRTSPGETPRPTKSTPKTISPGVTVTLTSDPTASVWWPMLNISVITYPTVKVVDDDSAIGYLGHPCLVVVCLAVVWLGLEVIL